ncbi:hypothetical protein NQ317_014789 [Molorchus minor]|uniref:Uncharacterized protein n=1 Tax=Molorchus minor TaxID=1323400 RepID=A0ABQ9J8Z3_9CUCU|nr:hypothetical protein NQ317_014789 [Molorchus minor]
MQKVITLPIIEEDSYEKDVLFYVQLGEPQMSGDEVASLAAEAEKKPAEERTQREKIAILGKPRLGDITRAQIRIKESKEFKDSKHHPGNIEKSSKKLHLLKIQFRLRFKSESIKLSHSNHYYN